MPYTLPTIDPSTDTSGVIQSNLPGRGYILLKNMSIYDLQLTFPDQSQQYLNAWTGEVFEVCGTGGQINWNVVGTSGNSTVPSSNIYATVYLVGEQIVGSYPTSYPRYIANDQVNNNVVNTSLPMFDYANDIQIVGFVNHGLQNGGVYQITGTIAAGQTWALQEIYLLCPQTTSAGQGYIEADLDIASVLQSPLARLDSNTSQKQNISVPMNFILLPTWSIVVFASCADTVIRSFTGTAILRRMS